jgi:hypothetical protein
LKKKPGDNLNAASRLGAAKASEEVASVARHEEEKKEEHLEFSCTGVGANTCKASNNSFLKTKPDDDRNAASRLGAAKASEEVAYVARHEEEKKEKDPKFSCMGIGVKTKRKPDDDRNAASRLGAFMANEEKAEVTRHEEEKKEEHLESSCTGVGVNTCKAGNESFLKKKPDEDRNAASRLGAAIAGEEEPHAARHEEENKEEHPEPDPQERTQAVVVKATKQKLDVFGFVFQHVEAFLWRDKRAKEVDPDLKQSGTDDSSPIKLQQIIPKPEQNEDMLDHVCNKVEGLVCRERGDVSEGSQQEDLEAGILMQNTKARVNILREHSLLDLDQSFNTQPTGSSSHDGSSCRLLELRKKKRNIESRIRSSSTEPGILVPWGYVGKSATPKAKPKLAPEVLAEKARKEQRKKKFMAVVIVSSFLAALVVVGISFFLSPTL